MAVYHIFLYKKAVDLKILNFAILKNSIISIKISLWI